MPNILFISSNEKFATDLSEQISIYATDFNVYREYSNEILYDIIIIDEDLEMAQIAHEKQVKVPVFLLCKEYDDSLSSIVSSFIKKPFSLERFLNQLRSSINLYENSVDGYLNFNKYILRPLKKDIFNRRNNEVIKLTEKEVAIIKYLYKAQNKIVTKNELLKEVWGYNPDVSTHTIETHIYRLRQKVEHDDVDAQMIVTLDGGYQLKF